MNKNKTLALVFVGNIIDYYDFLLFAHLGPLITSLFIPNLNQKEVHLLSLLLFALPFVVRPLGGYFFGCMSDALGRPHALSQSIKWAGFAAIGLAFLPSYEKGGVVCTILFILLRGLQGVSLGGEYPTAGTYLMEEYSDHRGLVSGLLVTSGTVGSLFAFGFAWLCSKSWVNPELWRVAFFLGGCVSFVSFFLRRYLRVSDNKRIFAPRLYQVSYSRAITLTLATGTLVSVTTWLPMTYSNFYLTKVLGSDVSVGLFATFISLVTFVIAAPIFGKMADFFSERKIMTWAALCVTPLSFLGFYMISLENLVGQVFLTLAAASFGAPIHVFMNRLFSKEQRSRNVNLFFMMGTALGSLAPWLSGYLTDLFHLQMIPVLIVSCVSSLTFMALYKLKFF